MCACIVPIVRAGRVTLVATGAALALAPAALAHGIHGDGSGSILTYLQLGWRHMLGGWDHLLFIAGVVLVAASAVRAIELLTLFAIGHSATLLAATLLGWQLDAELVDVLIAASVAYIGWRILAGRPERWGPTAAVVLGFGLVHGLGLSTRLQQLDLPDGWPLVARVVAFNIGVELAQIAVVSALLIIGALGLTGLRQLPWPERAAGGALVLAGLVLTIGLSLEYAQPAAASETPATVPTQGCIQRKPAPNVTTLGGHPAKTFYAPGEPTPEQDLAHVLGDGYVVVRYDPTLPPDQIKRLRRWANDDPFGLVVAPARDDADARLQLTTRRLEVACGVFAFDRVTAVREDWADRIRGTTK